MPLSGENDAQADSRSADSSSDDRKALCREECVGIARSYRSERDGATLSLRSRQDSRDGAGADGRIAV